VTVTSPHLIGEFEFDRFVVRPAARQVLDRGVPAKLGARAFDLLLALIERRERVVNKNELLELVWPGLIVEEGNLAVHVSALRRLFGPDVIATIPGYGYRFTVPMAADAAAAAAAGAGAGRPAPPATVEQDAGHGNLPDRPPQLIGRDADLQALSELIERHALVTVVGHGGIGKSRLALAAAHAARQRWAGGAWRVELSPVTDPALVPAAVAQVLGITLAGRRDAPAELAAALRTRELLLVLDNCEHLLQAAAELVTILLETAPGVRILATSQEPLRRPNEQQYRVPPLAMPDEDPHADPAGCGAVRLFEARARAADPHFTLGPENLAAVVEICRRLDGLPLAIELAAARVPLLGTTGVRERLDDRFRMLTAGARGGLPRHQTLRATFEWSFGLLGAEEQAVLRRLGVFAGSFGLESAQHVASDERIDGWAVLDHLGALVDKSLVCAEAQGGEPRYRLLETGRAWALEKLVESGELEATRRRHAQAMLVVFDRSYEQRWTVPANVRLARYLPDLDNLRLALDWAAHSAGDADLHVALMGAAAWVWFRLGRGDEGLRRCEGAIARIGAATAPAAEARLLNAWSQMAWPRIGAPERAAGERAVALYRAIDDRMGLYIALFDYGTNLARSGDLAGAERAFDEAGALHRPGWPAALRWVHLVGHINLRWRQGRHEDMQALCAEQLRLAEDLGNSYWALHALINLEQASSTLGRHDEAVARGQQLLARVASERFIGDLAGHVLANLTRALTEAGRLDEAVQTGRDALQEMQRLGMTLWMFLDVFALLALQRGKLADAARTLGRADAAHAARASMRPPNEQRLRDIVFAGLQALAPNELQRLLDAGAMLDDEDVARTALQP